MLIVAHDRRKSVRFDVTQHPTAGWLSRQVTEPFPWNTAPGFFSGIATPHTDAVFSKGVAAIEAQTFELGVPVVSTQR
jgi:hypothetical protein